MDYCRVVQADPPTGDVFLSETLYPLGAMTSRREVSCFPCSQMQWVRRYARWYSI